VIAENKLRAIEWRAAARSWGRAKLPKLAAAFFSSTIGVGLEYQPDRAPRALIDAVSLLVYASSFTTFIKHRF
jgi:hypothetical protein